jgi:hypothetical protein
MYWQLFQILPFEQIGLQIGLKIGLKIMATVNSLQPKPAGYLVHRRKAVRPLLYIITSFRSELA